MTHLIKRCTKILLTLKEIFMKLHSIKKVVLAVGLCSLAFNAMANAVANEDKIPCPSPNLVKQSWMLLDTVTVTAPGKFVVWEVISTLQDPEHRSWNIVTYADAKDMNGALTAGQEIVKNTLEAKEKYAMDMNEEQAICSYSTHPNSKLGVGLIFDKTRGKHNFRLIKLDLNGIK